MSMNGHDELRYDPDDPKQVKDIKNKIKKYLDEGYYLYGMKAGSNVYESFLDPEDVDSDDFDRFIVAAGQKKLLTAPVHRG